MWEARQARHISAILRLWSPTARREQTTAARARDTGSLSGLAWVGVGPAFPSPSAQCKLQQRLARATQLPILKSK